MEINFCALLIRVGQYFNNIVILTACNICIASIFVKSNNIAYYCRQSQCIAVLQDYKHSQC